MSVLLKKTLTTAFQPTRGIVIEAGRAVFRFKLAVTGGTPAVVQYYLEFGDDPTANGDWYREVAEENQSAGVVYQPMVVRTLQGAAGAAFAADTHLLSVEFQRKEQFARLQIKASAGAVVATVEAPYGQLL